MISNKINIELAERFWKNYPKQNIIGEIVKVKDAFKVSVEVHELPGEYVYFRIINKMLLDSSLNTRKVVGDIGSEGFFIRILCLGDVISIE